jgi:hypothetical protein
MTRDDPVGEAWPTATCHAGNFTRGNSDEDRRTRRHGRRARRVAELRSPRPERMAAIRPERESVPRIVGCSRGNLGSGCPAAATGDPPHPPGAHRAAVGAAAATRRRRTQRPAACRREDHEHAPTAARPQTRKTRPSRAGTDSRESGGAGSTRTISGAPLSAHLVQRVASASRRDFAANKKRV